ncbi:hypothetical protein AB434_3725 [Heyndrickxia coagulans]|uniref:Uncharacterized protein n=1 Tax=Heyndrickxia coagulans TaxID=1398 RepID=A0AAN0WB13_HEYCO|nr:hypothetical protein SB48_HM08orf02432 [Heyndrickxia coagulans]AKN56130.1 hypothetical protein AB434_3725 [Heyndrickxia coagulans]
MPRRVKFYTYVRSGKSSNDFIILYPFFTNIQQKTGPERIFSSGPGITPM